MLELFNHRIALMKFLLEQRNILFPAIAEVSCTDLISQLPLFLT